MTTKSNETVLAEDVRELNQDELQEVAGGASYQIVNTGTVASRSPYAVAQYPALQGGTLQGSFDITQLQVGSQDGYRS